MSWFEHKNLAIDFGTDAIVKQLLAAEIELPETKGAVKFEIFDIDDEDDDVESVEKE